MKSNRAVIEAFLDRKEAKSGSMSSEFGKLYSYSTVIAQWNKEGTGLIVNSRRYSPTTTRQQSELRRLVFAYNDVGKVGYLQLVHPQHNRNDWYPVWAIDNLEGVQGETDPKELKLWSI